MHKHLEMELSRTDRREKKKEEITKIWKMEKWRMANDSFISFLMDLRFTFYFYSLHRGYILYFSIVCVSIGMRDYPNEFIG